MFQVYCTNMIHIWYKMHPFYNSDFNYRFKVSISTHIHSYKISESAIPICSDSANSTDKNKKATFNKILHVIC